MAHKVSDPDLCPHEPPHELRLDLHPVPAVVLNGVGSEPVSTRWNNVAMRNPFWRLYVVDRPGIHLRHQGGRFDYVMGRITVIPAWLRFTFHTVADVGHTWIHFDTPSLPSTQIERYCPRPFHLPESDLVDELSTLGRSLAFHGTDPSMVFAAHALATRAWCRILVSLGAAGLDLSGQRSGRLAPVLKYIDLHLAQPISIADLAAEVGLGPAALSRLFQSEIGTSPGQYLIERRVRRAAELLVAEDLSLDAIAQRCGLTNRRYCTRVFTARMGMTPILYRHVYRQH